MQMHPAGRVGLELAIDGIQWITVKSKVLEQLVSLPTRTQLDCSCDRHRVVTDEDGDFVP